MEFEQIREGFKSLLGELDQLQADKLTEYGIGRYNLESTEASRLLCWSDIYRKRIRIEPMLLNGTMAVGEPLIEYKISLRQNLMDLASYCLMAIEVGENEGWL